MILVGVLRVREDAHEADLSDEAFSHCHLMLKEDLSRLVGRHLMMSYCSSSFHTCHDA